MPTLNNKNTPLLEIRNLSVEFSTYNGTAKVLENVRLDLQAGEILGLVGETGCGKSVLARSILNLIAQPPGRTTSGEVFFKGVDLRKISNRQMRSIRGNEASMIFQEPMSSLNPVFTVGSQMTELVHLHQGIGKKQARELCVDMLRQVQMPDPEQIIKKYPHELSGGMRQRVMIAMELSCKPSLLIADEPTTALDVTIQGQVLTILTNLARRDNIAILLITHDMGVVAQVCDRVAVMYAGKIVEVAPVRELFAHSAHPYTSGLIGSIPGQNTIEKKLTSIPGRVPSLINPPCGCRFHTRCSKRLEMCERLDPCFFHIGEHHEVACHLYQQRKTCN
jgi:peptide/nickel transport system ATP-binding protein